MQTDSIVRPGRSSRSLLGLVGLGILAAFCTGCFASRSVVVDDLLEPVEPPSRWLPEQSDLLARRLARAALITSHLGPEPKSSDDLVSPDVESALDTMRGMDLPERNENLLPLAIDLRNATLDNPIAYRQASRKLRRRGNLDPRIKSRLDRTIDDDPIRLAKRRQFDGWHRLWARTFNAVSEPLGSTLITGFVLAPYQLVNSIIHYFADFSNDEALSFTDRQALTLRKDFLRAHPDTELTAELEEKIADSTLLLAKTLALRRVRAADRAFDIGNPALALHQTRVAIKILTAHPEKNPQLRKRARRIERDSMESIERSRRHRSASLGAKPTPVAFQDAEQSLASALLSLPINAPEVSERISAYREAAGPPSRGRIEFILAMGEHENGYDFDALDRLDRLATVSPLRDSMGRHARTLTEDDWQNPHGAFERLERMANREELAWRLAGEWVRRTRYPNLPTPLAYLIDAPTIAITIILAPLRALISPWTGSPDFRRAPALAGYRYLVRYPAGAAQQPVVEWLFNYESDLKRWGRALRLADLMADFDSEERTELVEKTAEERMAQVDRLHRRDNRSSVLKGVARDFPDSAGGHEAGLRARAELEDASPQHIRITKSFLLENPSVANQNGIGLNPILLNDDDSDGELHPDGVLLRGGRVLEILLVADGAEDDDPPESRLRKISKRRLSRIAASLSEAVQLNSLIDVGARQGPDPNRDVFLERAKLGLTDEVDQRPGVESSFVYQSLRERYGLVRGRDSVLPFDLVFRGSLGDFTLGAFPRWRKPRETPDAFLYR